MNQATIENLRCRCIQHERYATNPKARKFWDTHFRRLSFLARRLGWID